MAIVSEVGHATTGIWKRGVGTDKAIGVATTNVTPGPTGVVPLSKQDNMIIEPESMATAAMASAEMPAETLDFGIPTGAPAPVNAQPLGEAVVNDTINASPIDNADPTALGGFDFSGANVGDTPFAATAAEPTPAAPVVNDMQIPPMPQVQAQEPTDVNAAIFADQPAEQFGQPVTAMQDVGAMVENPLDAMGSFAPTPEMGVNVEMEPAGEQVIKLHNPLYEDTAAQTEAAVPEVTENNSGAIAFDFAELKSEISDVIDRFQKKYAGQIDEKDVPQESQTDGLPVLPELSTDQPMVATPQMGVPTPTDDLMVDAMNQISDIGIAPVDENQAPATTFVPADLDRQVQGRFGSM